MELVVLSGKGGTGKTTVATCLAELANDVIKIDCDVDAPNLYLYYQGNDLIKEDFYGGKKAVIDKNICKNCGLCQNYCKFDAIIGSPQNPYKINQYKCEGCGACTLVCPTNAIKLIDEKSAETFITETDAGIISRAEMGVGSDGSGLLVTQIRKNAEKYTKDNMITIIDGSPGIGCAVIASITGSDIALIVTEPTKSGLEDLKRIVELTTHFESKTLVCINKYDINLQIADEIGKFCEEEGIDVVGKIPFDDKVRESINQLKPVVYYEDSIANQAIREMWSNISNYIKYN